jgi:hypothetical protein
MTQQDATALDNLLFLDCSTCFERYFRSSSEAIKLYLQLLVLHTYVAASWYHGRGGNIFAHHQELLSCIYSFWYYTRMLLPAGIMGELEIFSLIVRSI